MNSISTFTYAAIVVLAFASCARRSQPTTVTATPKSTWTARIIKLQQANTESIFTVIVETPIRARITFHEPNCLTSQATILPSGKQFTIHKRLRQSSGSNRPGTEMTTTINDDSPSIIDFGEKAGLRIPSLQKRILSTDAIASFGDTIVLFRNHDGQATTVTVDLESNIDSEMVRRIASGKVE